MPEKGDKERVKSLEKALNLLILLSRQTEDISLDALSREADISNTTCFRLLQTMKRMNFVEQCPHSKKYKLGPRNISIGMAALSKKNVRDLALPYMNRLRTETKESVNLSPIWPTSALTACGFLPSTQRIRTTIMIRRIISLSIPDWVPKMKCENWWMPLIN